MENILFNWQFEKNEDDFIYDSLKKLAESLKEQSNGVFQSIITITDRSDDMRIYAFHIGVPELEKLSWRIFEITTSINMNSYEIIIQSQKKGALRKRFYAEKDLITILNEIINENEIQNKLATYYNRVITKRKLNEEFPKEFP